MCYGCWEEAGKPAIVTPATKATAALVKQLYDLNCVGGNLHIVTDDWNLEDDHLAFCREAVTQAQSGKPEQYDDTHSPQTAIEAAILDAMEPMSEDERYSVLALESGFIEN